MLFAQWGMLAHAGTHLKSDPHVAAPAKAAQFCGDCLGFAPLQNAVGPAPLVALAVNPADHELRDVDAITAVPPRAFDAFRSRAPPVFL